MKYMDKDSIEYLRNGLYIVKWKRSEGGGISFAAVGRYADGTVWFAPTNWISAGGELEYSIEKIEEMILITQPSK
jgi:hypothetical protein